MIPPWVTTQSPFFSAGEEGPVLLQLLLLGRIIRKYMIANIPAMKMKSDDGLPPAVWARRT